jgi:hypothetical protein
MLYDNFRPTCSIDCKVSHQQEIGLMASIFIMCFSSFLYENNFANDQLVYFGCRFSEKAFRPSFESAFVRFSHIAATAGL